MGLHKDVAATLGRLGGLKANESRTPAERTKLARHAAKSAWSHLSKAERRAKVEKMQRGKKAAAKRREAQS